MMSTISPPVLYYHSVAPQASKQWVLHFLTLKLEVFEAEMRYLKAHQFRSIFLDEWLAIRQGRSKGRGDEVCLTFDDGLLDNWVFAYPIAKKHGQRLTLFVSPEYVDPRDIARPNLGDVWAGHCPLDELDARGCLSWKELQLMQSSGLVEVQSHTMSHAKFISSTRLNGFYYGGVKGLHPILNSAPSFKPFYLADPNFEQRLPWGTPLFEEQSAIIAQRHNINPDFYQRAATIGQHYNLCNMTQRRSYEQAMQAEYEEWQNAGALLLSVESTQEYHQRLEYEIAGSKAVLEGKLGHPAHFLCWPHGDTSLQAHELARKAGYWATTAGKQDGEAGKADRIPRIGAAFAHRPWLSQQKLNYKIAAHYRKQPYYLIWLANEFKNRVIQTS
jgi:peptidoglycan/xylan/chitin deacetylase (PgdA/CDA1 family)